MAHETRYPAHDIQPARRKSVLDTLEKPTVAVPMILVSALVGLALAVGVVRALDHRAPAPQAIPDVPAQHAPVKHPELATAPIRSTVADAPRNALLPLAAGGSAAVDATPRPSTGTALVPTPPTGSAQGTVAATDVLRLPPPVVARNDQPVTSTVERAATTSDRTAGSGAERVASPLASERAAAASGSGQVTPTTVAPGRAPSPMVAERDIAAAPVATAPPSVARAIVPPPFTDRSSANVASAGPPSTIPTPRAVPNAAPTAPTLASPTLAPSIIGRAGDVAQDTRGRAADVSATIPPVPPAAQRNVAEVLAAAAHAERPGQVPDVLDAAENVRRRASRNDSAARLDPARARRLNDEATRAYWERRDVAGALSLERRAFEANPNDVEIAGNLAFYYLKQERPEPDLARAAALHALTTPSGRYRMGRVEDWTSLGVASALLGRSSDARNAFLTTAALSSNVDGICRAALSAVASYGDAVRGPATALLYRVHAQGRSQQSPYCAWPPNWAAGRRYP